MYAKFATPCLVEFLHAYASSSYDLKIKETSDETAMELLKLVDEAAKYQIDNIIDSGDFLENFRKGIGRESC